MKSLLILLVVVVLLALVVAGCKATRAGYESPKYRVLRKDGAFELRDYPAMVVAETKSKGQDGSDNSFMTLFGYIAGGNSAKQKIAMTTPVLMDGEGTNRTMAFIVPEAVASQKSPEPTDAAVALGERPGGCFAVLRYSGSRSAAAEAKALARLKAWMDAQSLPAESAVRFGYYDPPWVPAFLRRNEVMVRMSITTNSPSAQAPRER